MAIDLFVTSQLIAEQKPEVQHFFIDKYLFPNTRDKDSKINVAMSNFETLNRAGLFFPVLLQELDFLGLKVFGKRKDTLIHSDVYGLIDFLLTVAERKIGEEIDLNYQQEYCNCAIVIVGKPYKISVSTSPYIKWIEGVIRDDNVESVYLIGLAKNQDFINQVCSGLDGLTEKVAEYEGEGELHYSDASTVRRDVFVATLRSKGIPIYSGER